jgi:TP901-1 family phage major tail protein
MAQSSGKLRSNALAVFVKQGSTEYDIVAGATSSSLSMEFEQLDITTKDESGATAVLPGNITWSIQCDGLMQYDTKNIAGVATTEVKSSYALSGLFLAKTKVTLAWSTGNEDDPIYTGDAYITSFEESAGMNEIASFSCTFSGNGAITQAASATGITFNVVDAD